MKSLNLKSIFAAVALSGATATVSALPMPLGVNFYLDSPHDSGLGKLGNVIGTYQLNATSTYTDQDSDGLIDLGDPVIDRGYADIPAMGIETENSIAAASLSTRQADGLNENWGLYLEYQNMQGYASYVDGAQVQVLAYYYSGTINLRYYELDSDGDPRVPKASAPIVAQFKVTSSAGEPGNANLFGYLDFSGTDAAYKDLFMSVGADNIIGTSDDQSFYDIWSTGQPNHPALTFATDLNTQAYGTTTNCGTDLLCRTSTLNAKTRFYIDIPEPSSVALFGVGLLGLGLGSRRTRKLFHA